jgi:Uma2 family endonuclease
MGKLFIPRSLGKKKTLYEQTFKTEEYFCFDYFNPEAEDSLKGFRLIAGRYQPIQPNEAGWLWSEKLGLWVGTWPGTYKRDQSTWMRFYTNNGSDSFTVTVNRQC